MGLRHATETPLADHGDADEKQKQLLTSAPEPAEAAAAAAAGQQKPHEVGVDPTMALHSEKQAAFLMPSKGCWQADQHHAAAESPAADLGGAREVPRLLLLWLHNPSARHLQPHAAWLQSIPALFIHCWLQGTSTRKGEKSYCQLEWRLKRHAIDLCMADTVP